MDHETVVRQKMTEQYLLNELDPELRDAFEDHFFDCVDCASDVRAGSLFVEKTKVVLAAAPQAPSLSVVRTTAKPVPGWFAWLRPALAAPVMALLLAVVGYQNLVTVPRMQLALKSPQVLPWASVNVGTWGAGGPAINAARGQGFLLFVRIPPEGGYTSYSADLLNPSGKLDSSLKIPVNSGQDQWSIQVPGAQRESGTYTLMVHGVTAAGETKDIGRTSFDLQVQK